MEDSKSQEKLTIIEDPKLDESLSALIQSIEVMFESINNINVLFKQNQSIEANKTLIELVEICQLFVELLGSVKRTFLRDKKFTEEIDQITDHEQKMLDVMENILKSKESNDDTLLCDLLEYELKDILLQWQKILIHIEEK